MKITFLTMLVGYNLFASLPLVEDYHKGREIAEMYEKPMVVVFVSKEDVILQETISSPAFAKIMEKECVFVKRESLSSSVVILLDKEGHEITRIGYQGQSSEEFACLLKERFAAYLQLLLNYEKADTESKLVPLYEKASDLGFHFYREKILEKGLSFSQGGFFSLEKYVEFVNQGKKDSPEAKALREGIEMHKDNQIGLRLALIDYQESGDVEPLETYIKGVGEQVNPVIIQYLAQEIHKN